MDIPLKTIASVRATAGRPLAWGVYSARDLWLVKGSRDRVVEIALTPPVTLKSIRLQSNSNPDDFVTVLRSYI